jgi:DcmR-like sensory protein
MISMHEEEPPISGSHICHLYHQASAIPSKIVQLIQEGLSREEKCLVAIAPAQLESFYEQVRQSQSDIDSFVRSGQLICQDERSLFLSQGKRFDPYFLLSWQQTFLARALQEGWQAGRIALDMTWLSNDHVTPEQIWKYEAASDAILTAQHAPIVVLIHYKQSTLTPDLLLKLRELHIHGDLWEDSF